MYSCESNIDFCMMLVWLLNSLWAKFHISWEPEFKHIMVDGIYLCMQTVSMAIV